MKNNTIYKSLAGIALFCVGAFIGFQLHHYSLNYKIAFINKSPANGASTTLASSSNMSDVESGRQPTMPRNTDNLQHFSPKSRGEFGEVLQRLGFSVGVELGVQRGLFAETLLETWPGCKKFILVDIWREQENYKDLSNADNSAQDLLYEETKTRLRRFDSKTVFMRMFTTEAAALIEDDSVDYIYVDARHDFCGASEDMETYWPKLKPGGIMAGHDFFYAYDPVLAGQDWSICRNGTVNVGAVRGAVEEFALKNKLFISITQETWRSWILRKPY